MGLMGHDPDTLPDMGLMGHDPDKLPDMGLMGNASAWTL